MHKKELVKLRAKQNSQCDLRVNTVPAYSAHSYSARLSYKVHPVISPSSYPTYFPLNWQRTTTNLDTLREIALSRASLRARPRAMILIERPALLRNPSSRRIVARALNHCVEKEQVRRGLTNFACLPREVFSPRCGNKTTLASWNEISFHHREDGPVAILGEPTFIATGNSIRRSDDQKRLSPGTIRMYDSHV